jgi:hypothetical protein
VRHRTRAAIAHETQRGFEASRPLTSRGSVRQQFPNLSQAFAGQMVGVKQVEEKIWLVSFMRYDLGFFDHETCRIESAANPFSANVSAMSPV